MRRFSSIALLTVISLVMFLVAGCGTPSLLITPVSNATKLEEVSVEPGSLGGGKIALIPLEGMIANAREGGLLQASENPVSLFTQELDRAADDNSVKAVVLRVNSPGGTVSSADALYDMIKRFRERTGKPVVASVQEVAASGAYYACCGCNRIVAQPTSLVGSIGVIFMTFDFSGTMNKIGVQSEAIKSGPLKDMGSPFRPMNAQDRAVMQGMIDEFYARFVGVVTSNRPVKSAELKTITDGRVFSGREALDLGLVDELGLLQDAISSTKKMVNAPNAKVVMYKRSYGYGGSIYAETEAQARGGRDATANPGGEPLSSHRFLLSLEPLTGQVPMISLPCTHCQKVLTIDEAFAGGVCRCQYCGTIQTVPAHLKPGGSAGAGTPPRVLYHNPLREHSQVETELQDHQQASTSAPAQRKARSKRAAAPVSVGVAHHKPLTWRAWVVLCVVMIAGVFILYLLLTRT